MEMRNRWMDRFDGLISLAIYLYIGIQTMLCRHHSKNGTLVCKIHRPRNRHYSTREENLDMLSYFSCTYVRCNIQRPQLLCATIWQYPAAEAEGTDRVWRAGWMQHHHLTVFLIFIPAITAKQCLSKG